MNKIVSQANSAFRACGPFSATSRHRAAGPLRACVAAIAVLLILIAAGCSKDGAAGGGFSMPPMPAEVAEVTVGKIEENFQAVGTIEADEAVTVVAEIDGTVTAVPYLEGELLQKGDLIATLDDRQLAAEASRAEALFIQSKATYERVKVVVEQGAGAPQDLDDASAVMKVAEANFEVAGARLAKAHITAPFSGTAGSRKVSVGSYVRPGQAITEMANLEKIRVIFSAPERMISQIRKGAGVAVTTTAFPGTVLHGRIIVMEPVIDPVTRTARVVAEVPNRDRKFRSGMSADITTLLSSRAKAVTIPNEAVFATGDQSFVFAVKADSTVTRQPVRLGTRTADVVEVLEGLTPGMKVVTAGHQKLFEGAKVLPVPGGAAGQQPPGGAKQ